MIDLVLFRSFAYPWRVYSNSGPLLGSGSGTLFREPNYERPADSESFFRSIRTEGWYVCPSKRLVFAYRQSSSDRLFIFPGLTMSRIVRLKSQGDRAPATAPSRPEFEHIVKEALEINEQSRKHLRLQTVAFTHDYRRINAALYHQGLRLNRHWMN